jgi:hypothetical protein
MNITSRRGHGRLGLGRTGAALLAAAGLALTGCSATSTEAAPSSVANAVERSAEPGPVLVTGTVSRDGKPLADMPVFVQIWSEEDIEIGESVEMHEIGPVRTDQQGGYAIVLDMADLAPRFRAGRDFVNFDVGISEPFIVPVATSAEWTEDGSWTDMGGGPGPRTMDFDLGTMKATETHGDGSTSRWPLTELTELG